MCIVDRCSTVFKKVERSSPINQRQFAWTAKPHRRSKKLPGKNSFASCVQLVHRVSDHYRRRYDKVMDFTPVYSFSNFLFLFFQRSFYTREDISVFGGEEKVSRIEFENIRESWSWMHLAVGLPPQLVCAGRQMT